MTHHPDNSVQITGRRVPDIKILTDHYFNLVHEYFVMLESGIDNKAIFQRAKRVESESELSTEEDTDTPSSDLGTNTDSETECAVLSN